MKYKTRITTRSIQINKQKNEQMKWFQNEISSNVLYYNVLYCIVSSRTKSCIYNMERKTTSRYFEAKHQQNETNITNKN